MESEAFSGARSVLKFNQNAVGYCLGVNGATNINYQPINAISHLEVIEHVPVAYAVEMSANLVRVSRFTRLAEAVNMPNLRSEIEGNVNSPQIMPAFGENGDAILRSGELSSQVWDRVTQSTITNVQGVKAQNKTWDSNSGSFSSENMSFVCRIANEPGENVAPFAV